MKKISSFEPSFTPPGTVPYVPALRQLAGSIEAAILLYHMTSRIQSKDFSCDWFSCQSFRLGLAGVQVKLVGGKAVFQVAIDRVEKPLGGGV